MEELKEKIKLQLLVTNLNCNFEYTCKSIRNMDFYPIVFFFSYNHILTKSLIENGKNWKIGIEVDKTKIR